MSAFAPGSRFRSLVAENLKKRRWILPVAVFISAATTALVIAKRSELPAGITAALSLFATSYLWGFATRAFRPPRWRHTSHLKRQQYGAVWDTLASSPQAAAWAVSGRLEEGDLRRSAEPAIRNLVQLAGIADQDDVLEIGCGIGRIGLELAPHCHSWTGSDVSKNMLIYAGERLSHLGNVRLRQLHNDGLAEFPDRSFDVVYCTNTLAHLDEIERWLYVKEAFRVLRTAGRLFIDTVDIESDQGWAAFVRGPTLDSEPGQPPYSPRASTAAELENYANRAGFAQVTVHRQPPLVILTARKPQ